ncbi:hypothetical protein EZJ43_03090 [Pedobacter changchengzhani]|uniref:Uncharacterized protein n=1 Tax=Pedobacter changchengzhani TaxID=2529274 RepID=A0A4R5MPM1_9SPHI|nr:hypothetical protein [Pedobacter changchengzhani]TDG37119.1 hypothetical protein EZJ43_03090 [Pedobacter changchengzhani]
MYLEINSSTEETIIDSFRQLAIKLFNDYKLIVNDYHYRLLDLEFYYYAKDKFEDIYAHKHSHQLQNGKWYSHGSGMDITFGDGKNYGGILVRAMAEITKDASKDEYFINTENQFHGPLKVKTEIFSKLNGAFDSTPNNFFLANISRDRHGALMPEANHVIEANRIHLNEVKDTSLDSKFHQGKFRFVIFPHLKLAEKTQIAEDMQRQFPHLTTADINKLFGSKFL